jgi:phosphatidylinositol alpha-1,6-mannosyltransferase
MSTGASKILVVSSELPPGPGGIGTHAHAVATALAREGRAIELLGCQHYCSNAERAKFNRNSEVRITTLGDGGDPVRTAHRRLTQVIAAVRSFQPDVILASGGRITWLAALASRRTRVPVVAVAHGTELGGPGWQRWLTHRALDGCDRVIAVSNYTAELVRHLGVTAPTLVVVPNGADDGRFEPDPLRRSAFRARHGLGDCPVVLTVGNVTERKGQHLVVEALPTLVESVPDVRYVAVGRPTEAAALQERARRLGVLDHLLLLGQVDADEVTDAHAAADVFAMTSTATDSGDVEGFGVAVLEAALSGVPAVVTTGTGAQEAVVDCETGLVVAQAGTAIAGALESLLTDPARRAAMGAAAERSARASGTWAHCGKQYAAILDEVVRGARPRIVVVSHTEHYRATDGSIVAFGPTTRELDHLATVASELVHIAPLHDGPAPGTVLPALAPNVRYVPVPLAGGDRPIDRLLALRAVPRWAFTINRELRSADIAHVRCPAGISMVALILLAVRRRPRDRWIKYAGNWAPPTPDALTYRVQRFWLSRGWARGVVTVNGRWPDQPPWIRPFDNPTLTDGEVRAGRSAATAKRPGPPHRVVFAGRLESAKGADVAVETVLELRRRNYDVVIDLIGDGPLRPWVEEQIASAPPGCIQMHGWISREELEGILAEGHIFLLPTASEGFPKVIGEAMAFGCVPVTSGVSSMGQVLGETGGAVVVDAGGSWTDAVETVLLRDREQLQETGLANIGRFTFATYLERLRTIARADWGRHL